MTDWSRVPWSPFEEVTELSAEPVDAANLLVVQNSRYLVFIRQIRHPLFGRMAHLSIKTHDREAHHDWRDFQRIKNELCGPELTAVEIYPKEAHLVDTSNQYHLWVFLECDPAIGFTTRLVADGTFEQSVQRPFDERPADCKDVAEIVLARRQARQ